MLLACVLISGCQTTTGPNACAGWAKLHPSLETSLYILKSDRAFSNEVAAHNRFGVAQRCWK
jgi:hypothetical protein